jgi:peptidoglycan/LPS O-acetylase OafA/YrhL
LSGWRIDIQALRGVAVALVVLDHAQLGPFAGGYLGVDIFFVISGFLISGILLRQLSNGSFSFADFYFHRARRILPAAYVTILATSLGSIWFVNSVEVDALFSQVIGAVTFTINFVLWGQAGYFDVEAAYKPLLHMWSLAVEEQFYLVFPAILAFTPSTLRFRTMLVLLALSAGLCFYLVSRDPQAAFYLLPTRAWELLLGGVGAVLIQQKPAGAIASSLRLPAVALLVAVPIWPTGLPHPGVDAALVCLATLTIILADNRKVAGWIPVKAIAWLGDISYSLYLVHWPVMVFVNSAYVTPVPVEARLVAVVISVCLAVLLNYAVEEPFRKTKVFTQRFAMSCIGAAGILVAVQAAVASYSRSGLDFAYERRPNYGLNKLCDNFQFEARDECRTSAAPAVMIWGDSYAMHAVPGVVRHIKGGLVQATYSACPPFMDSAPFNPLRGDDAERVAKLCILFNDGVLRAIGESHSITTVILGASFWQYTVAGYEMLEREGVDTFARRPTSLENTEAIFGRTIAALRASGKKVVVIGPPPGIGDENVKCMERVLSGKLVFGDNPKCELAYGAYEAGNRGVIEMLDYVERTYGVQVVHTPQALCSDGFCRTILDGVPIYRDSGHLSYRGAEMVFDRLAVMKALWNAEIGVAAAGAILAHGRR